MKKPWVGLVVLIIGAAGCPGGGGTEVCYQGPSNANDACLPLVGAGGISDPAQYLSGGDFTYPAPLGGSRQYTQPVRFLDLSDVDGGTAVAPNFLLRELAQQSKGRYAIVQKHAVRHLQDIRDDLGVLTVNSGYRSPGYNSTIPNSATYSRHTYGDAFDLDPAAPGVDLGDLDASCRANGAAFTNVYVSHVHCDWRDDTLDGSFYGSPTGPVQAPDVTTSYRLAQQALDAQDAWVVDDGVALGAPAVGWPEGEPLREWTAYDAWGDVIETATVTTYVPPSEAAEVEVVVGRRLHRWISF